jgi:hypothetical protein
MAKPTAEQPPSTSPFAFSPQEAMEFMQRMWNPFGVPMPGLGAPAPAPAQSPTNEPAPPGASSTPSAPTGFHYPNPASMFITLDPADIERKIGELRVIEGWLAMSLNLMQMSIRTLELQKASLEALRVNAPSKPEGGRGRG